MRDTRPHIKLCYVQRNFTGTPSRWTERTCELSRAPNVSTWTLAHRCSDSCCSHSRTQQPHRTQTARNIEPLAGASSIGTRWRSVSFSHKQNAFWRRGNCFHEAQPRSLHVLEPLADDHSSDSDDAPTGVEESAAPAVAAAPKRSHESA